MTATRLVGVSLTAGLVHGQVAVGVAIDAGLAAFVHPGDRVDILAGRPDNTTSVAAPAKPGAAGARVIAEAVAVLAILRGSDAEASSGATLVLVAVERGIALRIAALDGRQVLAVVGGPP